MSWKNEDLMKYYETPWDGWYFKNGHLWDGAGNRYSERDVNLSWQSGLIVDNHFGKTSDILMLKNKLEKRVKMNKTLPTICLVWKSENGDVLEKVYSLKEK